MPLYDRDTPTDPEPELVPCLHHGRSRDALGRPYYLEVPPAVRGRRPAATYVNRVEDTRVILGGHVWSTPGRRVRTVG
jgi:hypothetical protein